MNEPEQASIPTLAVPPRDDPQVGELTATPTRVRDGTAQPVFDEADRLLLTEARARFDYEQKVSGALHTKATLFLTLTGVFIALVATSVGRLLETSFQGALALSALAAFVVSLGLFVFSAMRLTRSSLQRTYQVIATPRSWVEHLATLRAAQPTPEDSVAIAAHLEADLLDAWAEAVEVCSAANHAKALALHQVALSLRVALPIGFLGFLLLVLHSLRP